MDSARQVYGTLTAQACTIARAGHSVIVDAGFARPEERAAIEAATKDAGAAFTGIWLEAPAARLEARIAARKGDASDATVEVLRRQLAYDLGPIAWQRVDASDGPGSVADRVAALAGFSAQPVR
jgi:predicted kinase